MPLSRWIDNSRRSMEEILENMLNYPDWHIYERDPISGENLGFFIQKMFAENKEIILNKNKIYYNYIEYAFERIRPGEEGNEMRSSRVYSTSGYIIIYTDGTTTQYITNRSGNAGTKTILRKLNNYNGKLEITEHPFRITEDVFTWMIYKVLNSGEKSLEADSHLLLKKIIGFKGATNDQLAEVKGTGNRIMNLLSTLAFLFENEKVSYIKPRVEYQNDTIEFSMDLSGTIDIDLDTYVGDYMMDEEYEKNSKVILKTFLEIIPKILTNYHLDVENDEWSIEKRNHFFTSIGEIIKEKIKEKINLDS